MNSLRVRTWQDWEYLCKYLGQNLVMKKLGQNVIYVNYGSPGQKQHGVDLVPSTLMTPAVVIQCKHLEGSLSWDVVLSEILKTNSFIGEIDHYCVFTTGSRHTSVQDHMCNGGYTHTRPNGKTFKVHVYYWEDVNPTEEIPSNVINSFFPQLSQIATQEYLNVQYVNSVTKLRETIPTIISMSSINWLETWDFSCGYVLEKDYRPFQDLYFELNRMGHALDGIQDWLKQGRVSELALTLPAGERFYSSLNCFYNSIYQHIIGITNADGESVLSINELSYKQQLVIQWRSNALSLAQVYREDVLGQRY